jgi:hypothetical protein
MELKKIFKKMLNSTCIIFTIVTAAYMLVLQLINISDAEAAVEAGRVLLFFVFSLLLSLANALLSIEKIIIDSSLVNLRPLLHKNAHLSTFPVSLHFAFVHFCTFSVKIVRYCLFLKTS